ncbi:MAG: type I-F CRISPR-associated protein Csy1 [Algiphilus sp.]
MNEPSARTVAFRKAIATYIEECRKAKLKGGETPTANEGRYEYHAWLADAASRAKHLQSVTHVVKATHPSAKGSNVYLKPTDLLNHPEIGTHSLDEDFVEDTAVDNARHLDVFSFLKQIFDGRRLLDWIRDDDSDLRHALHANATVAGAWMAEFQALIRTHESPKSHPLAKQVYWCVHDEPVADVSFHLLQPLFASSLEQAVHTEVAAALWEEPNKSARKAKRDNTPLDVIYHDYRRVVVRKLGGSNTQNVSQLNSERRGDNYLLASLPPHWKAKKRMRSLLDTDSAMDRFGHFGPVLPLVRHLAHFLLTDPPPTAETRKKRECIEQAIGQELPMFAATIRASYQAGWTRDERCHLPQHEKLWLDPDRTELPIRDGHEEEDQQFINDYHLADWPSEIANRFGAWLTARLVEAGLKTAGDSEFHHFARQAIVDAQWPVPMQRRAGGRT